MKVPSLSTLCLARHYRKYGESIIFHNYFSSGAAASSSKQTRRKKGTRVNPKEILDDGGIRYLVLNIVTDALEISEGKKVLDEAKLADIILNTKNGAVHIVGRRASGKTRVVKNLDHNGLC